MWQQCGVTSPYVTLEARRGDRLAGLSAIPALDLQPNRASRAGRLVRKFAPGDFRACWPLQGPCDLCWGVSVLEWRPWLVRSVEGPCVQCLGPVDQ